MHKNLKNLLLAAVFGICGGMVAPVQAAVLLSNFDQPNGMDNLIYTTSANAINVTAPQTYVLDAVKVLLHDYSPQLPGGGTPWAGIYSDDGGNPGSLLTALIPGSPLIGPTFQPVTFTGVFTFQANVQYWLAFESIGGLAGIATSSAAFAGVATSNRLVSLNTFTGQTLFGIDTPAADGLLLELTGTTSVPLPATVWLLALGLAGQYTWRRRWRAVQLRTAPSF